MIEFFYLEGVRMMKLQRAEKTAGVFACGMFIFLILLISVCSAAAAEEAKYSQTRDIFKSGEIKGTLQCDTGGVIVDAWVYTPGDSFTAVTDSNGSFIMRFVPEGTYALKISWDTGDGQITKVLVKPKMTTDLGVVKITCPVLNPCLGKADGFPCDDDDICTANDACNNGFCTGKPVDCNDRDQCTEDECAPIVGCTHQLLTGAACSDGNACTVEDTCDNGLCAGRPLDCNDWNHCTKDECDMKTGCIHQPLNDMACDDGNSCTAQDICANGTCTGTTVDCNDKNQCTEDRCDTIAGCLHQGLNGSLCSDGNECTANDTCVHETCSGTPRDCDDHNQCTQDGCDAAAGCTHQPLNGTVCDDHNACTSMDSCIAGVCKGQPVTCNDSNPCTADSCDIATGCVYSTVSGVPCDDSNPCTSNDACHLGLCRGLPVDCGDGDECTDDVCTPDKGCAHSRKRDSGCSN
jgi:hypothetical protein